MAYILIGDKPLSEPMLTLFANAYILGARGRWVKQTLKTHIFSKWHSVFASVFSAISSNIRTPKIVYIILESMFPITMTIFFSQYNIFYIYVCLYVWVFTYLIFLCFVIENLSTHNFYVAEWIIIHIILQLDYDTLTFTHWKQRSFVYMCLENPEWRLKHKLVWPGDMLVPQSSQ